MKSELGKLRRKSAHLHKAHREALWKTDPRCFWCATELSAESASLDHILPLGLLKERAEVPQNWVLACGPCQKRRKDYGEEGKPYLPHHKQLEQMTWYLRYRGMEETAENYRWSLHTFAPIGFGQIDLYLSSGQNLNTAERLNVQKVCLHWNPLQNPPWGDCHEPISIEQVKAAWAAKKFEKKERAPDPEEARDYHIRRIAFFCQDLRRDPIEIDFGAAGHHPAWPILDGNHRLAAHLVKRRHFFHASASGDVEIIKSFRLRQNEKTNDPHEY